MERPPQVVLVKSPELKQDILNGTRKIGILYGHFDYKIGDVAFCSEWDPWVVMGEITEVRHTTPREISTKEYVALGFKEMDDWLGHMHEHESPDIAADSPTTLIRWDNLSGALVEEVERMKALRDHYPQECQCQDYTNGLVANDCHLHNENPRHFVGDEDLPCDCDVWKNARATCDNCSSPAVWVRCTQFSGDHFFCDADARVEPDFEKENPSYFFWKKLK